MISEINKRKVAVFTGNRAEYGLQYPIIKAIAADPRLNFYLLVSGAHLKEDFGKSLKEIQSDGFDIYAQVKIDMPGDSLFATAQAIGTGIISLSKVLAKLQPDFLVVYADRFEGFSAVITGTQMGIPTVHIEGGDYTEGGALDDSVRHAMTKLSHLHMTTNAQAADRILRMGEEPWRVFNVGFPALDLIASGNYASPDQVYERYQLDPGRPVFIFTQHSITTEYESAGDQFIPSLEAIKEAVEEWNCQFILTYPNDDAGARRIMEKIEELNISSNPSIQIHRSLGRYYYHGVLNIATACMGNSSSGIKETPAFHCPCINIGKRQQGRLRGDNVIDVGYNKDEIKHAIWQCLFDENFRAKLVDCTNPYGVGNAGPRIAEVLATIPLDIKLIQKKMMY